MRYLLFLLPFCWACADATPDVERTPDAGPDIDVVDEAVSTPTPPFEVYDSFDELAPLFEAEPATPTLVNFWATWCKPCVEELPYLEQLRGEVPEDELRIVLVSLDFPQQIESKLVPFLEKNPLQSEVVVLTDSKTNDWIPRVHDDWEGAIPVTIYRTGERSAFHRNKFEDYAALRAFVGS